jgi:eukaryotic-like serine/threonine-protein kinase
MPLPAGSQLGPYEILAPLGSGGMGEVYKARDVHLGREVAIKTIASKRAVNDERRQRFLQEARAASALNHPGIVTIYDISRSGEVDYIVMEYVRGRTLDRVIGKHGLGVQEAIRYALQIADALSRAHTAGIVHRDLKPANIMITDDGLVKILDFGLAKLGDIEEVAAGDATLTIYLAQNPTQEGVVVGTAAYMSPEQAEGRKVDARSDIFSFGAVLYEMVTGQRAFPGDSSASTMAAVLKSEPKPPSQLVEGVPPDLERIIRRCLRKEPARRFQHVTDLKVDLEELKEATESGESVTAVPARSRSRKSLWIAAGIALPLVLAAGWLLRSGGKAVTPQYEPIPLTTFEGSERNPSLSPDGSQVVFTWDGERNNVDLYAMVVGTGTAVRLTTNEAADLMPSWSPDNRWIAFLRGGQGIFLIPPIGGGERKLADWPGASSQMSWSPDGKHLAFARWRNASEPGGIFVIPSQGGAARRVTRANAFAHVAPSFSPDGRRLAFADCLSDTSCGISVVELDAALEAHDPPRVIAEPSAYVTSISWVANGKSVLIGQSTTGADTFRLARLDINGKSPLQRLAFAPSGARDVTLSRTGSRLAYAQYYADSDIFAIRDEAMSRSLLSSTRGDSGPQYSPDGMRVALYSYRSGAQEVWVANADGSNAVQLTTSRASGTPRWSPDSRRIVFDTQGADGRWRIRVVDAAGGQPAQVVRDEADDKVPSFSRDGKWIYFASNRGGRDEIYRVPIEGGEPARMTDNGGYVAFESIDGESLYYTKTAGGCTPLFVRPVRGGPERQVADSVCARGFVVNDRGIYHISGNLSRREYVVQLLDPVTGKSTVLWKIDSRLYLNQGLAVSPDGKTILISASRSSGADLMLVEGFR